MGGIGWGSQTRSSVFMTPFSSVYSSDVYCASPSAVSFVVPSLFDSVRGLSVGLLGVGWGRLVSVK